MTRCLAVAMSLLFAVAAATADAQVPANMSYQGTLTDLAGAPVANGNYTITFRLYDVDQGGAPRWTETHLLPVVSGVFSAVLGAVTPLDFPFDRVFWLGVTVDGGAEMSPRRKLTASAYSLGTRSIDSGVAVTSLNGLKDDVSIVGGANVSIAQQGNTLTISSGSGGGTTGGNTLDGAYDQGGAGMGRQITADAGPVHVKGADGMIVDSRILIGDPSVIPEVPLEVYSSDYYAIYGETDTGLDSGAGVFGALNTPASGPGSSGVIGVSLEQTALSNGVWGDHASIGIGVYGTAPNGFGVAGFAYGTTVENVGVYGESGAVGVGWAGYMYGDLGVVGQIYTGGGAAMLIDHPDDPERRLLYHPSVNSPEMMNVYNGNVTLDATGQGTVALPDYFETLNGDYRYQLTAIGAPAPGLHVAEEIAGNQFRIAGGAPGMTVSWMVTGVRRDPQAQQMDRRVERAKPAHHAGRFFNPAVYGHERSMSTLHASHPTLLGRVRAGMTVSHKFKREAE